MGTSWHMSGSIAITPHLKFAEIKKAQEAAMAHLRKGSSDQKYAEPESVFENYMPFKIMTDEFDKETEDGTLRVVRGIALVPSHQEGSLSYEFHDLMTRLQSALPGHNWDGAITALREDATHASRIVCKTEPGADKSIIQVFYGKTFIHWDRDALPPEPVDLYS